MSCWAALRSLGCTRSRNVEMDGSVLVGSKCNIRNSSGDQKHRFVATFKAQVPVRVSLCPSAMYASLRLISAAARRCLPSRLSVRGRLILLFFLTMRGVRSTVFWRLITSSQAVYVGRIMRALHQNHNMVPLPFHRRRSTLLINVRFWHKAEISTRSTNVRFWGFTKNSRPKTQVIPIS